MSTVHQAIDQYIDQHLEQAIALLQEMIRQPSTQGHEAGVQQIVHRKMKELGLAIDQWDPSHAELLSHPYFVPSRDSFAGSPNLVAVWQGEGGGKSIILNGHIDVVPEGDRSKWTFDPYGGTIANGRVYGRGTTDMKGGNVSLILAIESLRRSGIKLKGDVIFHSVIEEESGGAGTLATLTRGYRADAAIIPEPTNRKLFIKQQGSMWFRVTIEGRSAHAGTRYEGVSAIEKAMLVQAAILELEKNRNAAISDPLYTGIPIPIPINVGKIQGGSWPSSVADLVTMEGRIGVGPHEEMETVKQQLRDHLSQLGEHDRWLKDHPVTVEFFGAQWVPNAVDASHPFVEVTSRHFQNVYEQPIKVEASPWGTDGGLLGKVGAIPTLVIGPGETRLAHYPDEYIEIEEVRKAAKLFARIVLDWCGYHSG